MNGSDIPITPAIAIYPAYLYAALGCLRISRCRWPRTKRVVSSRPRARLVRLRRLAGLVPRLNRNPGLDPRADPRLRFDEEVPPEFLGQLAHLRQPEMLSRILFLFLHPETLPVVGDQDAQRVILPGDL